MWQYSLREETLQNKDLWNLFLRYTTLSAKENTISDKKLYDFQRKHTQSGHNLQAFVPQKTMILGY